MCYVETFLCRELECDPGEARCQALLCPAGWEWELEAAHCFLPPGVACCPPGHHLCNHSHLTQCFNQAAAPLQANMAGRNC